MPKSVFEYNGRNCRDFNCYKTQPINFPTPAKDFDLIEVPGRNGDIILDNGHYKNVEIVIECFIDGDFLTYYDAFRAFLMSDHDYHKLVDSLYPDEYRLACVRNVEAKIKTPKRGTVEITMSCQPQRFLKSGDLEIELNFTDNPTGGTAWDGKTDLDVYAQAQIDDLNLMDNNVIFPSFTLARNAEFVYLKTPHNDYRWVYPNNHILYTGRYDICTLSNDLDAGDEFHVAATTSPFLSVWDEQGEIYTPSYYGTVINNPTEYTAVPIIKVYLDQNVSLGLNYFDTAFGVDADNYVIYRQYAENNESGLALSEKTIYIDCESNEAYSYDVTGDGYYYHNKAAIFCGQITIPPGRSVFRISNLRADFDDVDKITLIPRWWTL